MATTKKPAPKSKPPKAAKPPAEDGVFFSRTERDEVEMARVYAGRVWSVGFMQTTEARELMAKCGGKVRGTFVEKRPVVSWRPING